MQIQEIRALVEDAVQTGRLIRAQGTVLSTAEGYNYAAHAVLGALAVNLGTLGFQKYCEAQAAATGWLGSRGNPISQRARKLSKAAQRDPTVRELMDEVHGEFLRPLIEEQSRLAGWALPAPDVLGATCAMLLAKILWDMDLGNRDLANRLPMLAPSQSQSDLCRIDPDDSTLPNSKTGSESTKLTIDELVTFLSTLVIRDGVAGKLRDAANAPHDEEVNAIEACVLDLWAVVHPAWRTLRPTLDDDTCTAVLDRMRLAVLEELIDSDELTCAEADAVQDLEERRYAEYDNLVRNRTPTLQLGSLLEDRLHRRDSGPSRGFSVLTKMGMTLLAEILSTTAILRDIEIQQPQSWD